MFNINGSRLAITLLYLLLLSAPKAFSQSLISGRVATADNAPIQGATVTLQDGNNNIVKYAITDKVGRFLLKVNSPLPSFTLIVRSMSHATLTKKIENQSQDIPLVLQPAVTQLKEVVVKNDNPIRKKGDTLSYIVNNFADQKDRSIADVLAKMPGIEILPDGKVLYMGKPIQKYYIEGMDLLEGKYNLANNNLPHQSVSSVQVIENHQPIRVLDSLVGSDRASINIKLKNNIAFTGTAKLGMGFSPLLWAANITPMLFTKKRQLLLSYQANNMGNDIARELKTHTLQELMESLDNPTEKKDILGIIPLQLPNIGSHRFLNNNAHLLTANHISKLKKDAELRFNISYFNDNQLQEGENVTEFFLPTNNVVIQEKVNNRIFANDLQSNLALEKNTPHLYFKNSLKAQINWEAQRGMVVNNGAPIVQQFQNPYYSVSNQLKVIKKYGKQLATIYSLLNFNRAPHTLGIYPGQFVEVLNNNNPYERVTQHMIAQTWQANQYIEFTQGKGAFTLAYKMGFNLQRKNIQSDIAVNEKRAEPAFQNEQNYTNTNLYLSPNIFYKKKQWDIQAKLPLQYNRISVKDPIAAYRQNQGALVVQPRINLRYEINKKWQSSLGVGYDNSFQNADQILLGYVLGNYRNLQRRNYPIAQARSLNFSTGISYRNVVKSLFFHALVIYARTRSPFMLRNDVQPNGTQTLTVLDIANNTQNYTLNSKISQYLHSIKTTLTLSFDANYQRGNQFLGNRLTPTTNQVLKPGFKVNTQLTKQLGLDYSLETNFNHNKTAGVPAQDIFASGQQLRLNFYPAANQYCALLLEHYYNDAVSADNQHNSYIDFFYRYTIPKKKIDVELRCMNLLNTRYYIRSNFNDFYFSQSSFIIRPRQFLASVSFSL
jgi:hypothetical protein